MPIIKKLGSSDVKVRAKTAECIQHITKRVRLNNDIQLPLPALLSAMQETPAVPLVRNVCSIFIPMACDRLPSEDMTKIVFTLIAKLRASDFSQRQQTQLQVMFVRHFPRCKFSFARSSQSDSMQQAMIDAGVEEADLEAFIPFAINYMLLVAGEIPEVPAALSKETFSELLAGRHSATPADLAGEKLNLVKFLRRSNLPDNLTLLPILLGSADANTAVREEAEDALKRQLEVSYEDRKLVATLCQTYLLGLGIPNRGPLSPSARMVLLAALGKVSLVSIQPDTLRIMFDALFGEHRNRRLQLQGMAFCTHLLQRSRSRGEEDRLLQVCQVLLTSFLRVAKGVLPDDNDAQSAESEAPLADSDDLIAYAYTVFGHIAKYCPLLIRDEPAVILTCLSAVRVAPQRFRLSVLENLSGIARAYRFPPSHLGEILLQRIRDDMSAQESGVRLACVQVASAVFPFSDAPATFALLLGCADASYEVKEMATRALESGSAADFLPFAAQRDGVTRNIETFPVWAELLTFVTRQVQEALQRAEDDTAVPFGPAFYQATFTFLERCLNASAEVFEVQPALVVSLAGEQALRDYISLVDVCFRSRLSVDAREAAAHALKGMVLMNPELFYRILSTRQPWLLRGLQGETGEMRFSFAFLWGFMLQGLPHLEISPEESQELTNFASSSMLSMLNAITEEGSGESRIQQIHGGILAVSLSCSVLEDTPSAFSWVMRRSLTDAMMKRLCTHQAPLIRSVSAIALGVLGTVRIPPMTASDIVQDHAAQIQEVVTCLLRLLNDPVMKVVQAASQGLTLLSLRLRDNVAVYQQLLDGFFATRKLKSEDVIFSIGECLALLIGGTEFCEVPEDFRNLLLFVKDFTLIGPLEEGQIGAILNEIMGKHCREASAASRQAGAAWLMTIMMRCERLPACISRHGQFQVIFANLLTDTDDLVQDIASSCIGWIFDRAPAENRSALVSALVGTFLTGKKTSGTLERDEEEEIVPGGFGVTPNGDKLTTYKEICSLCNDIGQPELVYRFVAIASQHGNMMSRRGAAFGFERILSMAQDELEPFLPKLLPRLYRMQFDPSPMGQTMSVIWKGIVKERGQQVTEKYFSAIVRDVVASLGDRLWRTRESACHAGADLISGRPLEQVEGIMEPLLQGLYRCMDDIKETVRIAALSALRRLRVITRRMMDPHVASLPKATAAIRLIFPLIVKYGLKSGAEDVRKFALNQILELSRSGAEALQEQAIDLILVLIDAVAASQSSSLDYAQFHVSNPDALEMMRLADIEGKPEMEGVYQCLRMVASTDLKHLASKLSEIIRTSVGLPARVATAKTVQRIVVLFGQEAAPIAATLWRVVTPLLLDASIATRMAFGSAAAALCRISTDAQAAKVILYVRDKYLQPDVSSDLSRSAAKCLLALFRETGDKLTRNLKEICPIAFVGCCDEDAVTAALFSELWSESALQDRSGLINYAAELVLLTKERLEHSSWSCKTQGARILREVALRLEGSSLPAPYESLLPILWPALGGRYWQGKASFQLAFAALFSGYASVRLWRGAGSEVDMLTVCLSEVSKGDAAYRVSVWQSLLALTSFMGEGEIKIQTPDCPESPESPESSSSWFLLLSECAKVLQHRPTSSVTSLDLGQESGSERKTRKLDEDNALQAYLLAYQVGCHLLQRLSVTGAAVLTASSPVMSLFESLLQSLAEIPATFRLPVIQGWLVCMETLFPSTSSSNSPVDSPMSWILAPNTPYLQRIWDEVVLVHCSDGYPISVREVACDLLSMLYVHLTPASQENGRKVMERLKNSAISSGKMKTVADSVLRHSS